jgi:hypothetical protein
MLKYYEKESMNSMRRVLVPRGGNAQEKSVSSTRRPLTPFLVLRARGLGFKVSRVGFRVQRFGWVSSQPILSYQIFNGSLCQVILIILTLDWRF